MLLLCAAVAHAVMPEFHCWATVTMFLDLSEPGWSEYEKNWLYFGKLVTPVSLFSILFYIDRHVPAPNKGTKTGHWLKATKKNPTPREKNVNIGLLSLIRIIQCVSD